MEDTELERERKREGYLVKRNAALLGLSAIRIDF